MTSLNRQVSAGSGWPKSQGKPSIPQPLSLDRTISL